MGDSFNALPEPPANGAGTPIYLKDIARIQLGPEIRRGVAELAEPAVGVVHLDAPLPLCRQPLQWLIGGSAMAAVGLLPCRFQAAARVRPISEPARISPMRRSAVYRAPARLAELFPIEGGLEGTSGAFLWIGACIRVLSLQALAAKADDERWWEANGTKENAAEQCFLPPTSPRARNPAKEPRPQA